MHIFMRDLQDIYSWMENKVFYVWYSLTFSSIGATIIFVLSVVFFSIF